ncbi:Protocadherin alpha-5 [Schistosoma japonicum]|nr:Protocadherin alpha-5 [Schistosoma japonicum]
MITSLFAERGPDSTEDPSEIDCTIILEFALISQNRTFKPILINIPVNIRDINDNTPRFDQYTSGLKLELSEDISTIDHHYLLSMLSSSAPTTASSLMLPYWIPSITTESSLLHSSTSNKKREIATLPLAKDFDYGLNGTVAYKLEGPDAEYFELLNHTTNVQHTNSFNPKLKSIKSLHLISRFTLDRERKSEYRLILLAFDQSLKIRHTAQLPINIYVKEVNEYAPQFNLGVNITTNQQSDTVQQLLNNEHKIIGHPNRFHPQARIKSFSKLFLDKQQQSQQNQVSESDSHIQLPNPNYLTLGLPENINVGSRIYRVQAIDFDSIDFSTINDQYSYQSTHPRITVHYFIAQETDLGVKHYFRLGKEDGWITLLQRLDYESGSRTYILPIVAVDFGRPQLSNTLTLTIQVLDVNDEAPSITIRGIEPTRTNYNHQQQQHIIGHSTLNSFNSARFQVVTIRENSPIGTFIAKVSARDRDTGTAGEVECYLNEAENFGRKISDTSHLFRSDYSKDLYNFQLHPVDDDSIYAATISNNIEPIVSSTYIQYSSSNIQGRHDIEYILETKTILDREEKSSYFIYVTCHDYAEKMNNINSVKNYPTLQINNVLSSPSLKHRLSSTKLLKINILDENDNGPQFDRLRYEVKISENSPENTELIQLNAIDNDEIKHINYRFFEYTDQFIQNYTDLNLNLTYLHFKIDSKTGLIKTTNIPLDREVKDSILLPVIAYDDEFPSRTTHTWIYVQIEDVNDNIPQLIGNTTFWIDEEGSIMEYLVSSINHSRINNNITKIAGTQQYNSNHHIFIGHLNGKDQDIGENGQIIFTLGFENQYNGPKWILRSDGNLFVQSTINNEQSYLDREKTSSYEIPIIISDLGKNPTLSSTSTVTVILKDINDNSPKFIKPSYSYSDFNFHLNISHNIQSSLSRTKFKMFNIPSERINLLSIDNTNPGTLIYSVQAIDYDDGDNGKIIYKLEVYEGNWQLTDNSLNNNSNKTLGEYFIIDQTSGEIRINKPITIDNLQTVPKCLIISAEDCGVPSRRNYALLYIDFINEEETQHSFNKTYNHFNRSLPNTNNKNFKG